MGFGKNVFMLYVYSFLFREIYRGINRQKSCIMTSHLGKNNGLYTVICENQGGKS